MSPTASPHFVELDPMHGGCPNEWNNYEDYEAEDLVAVVVSGGCESPTTPKPTKSPLKLTPKPTNQFCFDTPAPSASPITPAPSKSPITPQPSASPSKNVRYHMFSLCLELIELVLLIHIPMSSPHIRICQPSSSPSESPTVCIVLCMKLF